MTATIPGGRRLLLAAAPALVTLALLAGRASAADFTAATLNIWHDQGDWPARRAVILDTLRVLSPDVLFLQEVLEKEGLPNQAQQLADSLGWGFVFASVDPPGAAKRYGNAILTRHRIVATHEIMLPPLDDYRVAAHARLEAGGRTVDAYVTHLHHTAEGAHIRAEQVRGLLAFVDSTRGEGELVIGGDFNAGADKAELAPLLARYHDCYAKHHPEAAGGTVTTLNPAMGHAPSRIDHLFVEPGGPRPVAAGIFLAAPSPSGVWASDHFGVWARLR